MDSPAPVPATCQPLPTWRSEGLSRVSRIMSWSRRAREFHAPVAVLESGCSDPPPPAAFWLAAVNALRADAEEPMTVIVAPSVHRSIAAQALGVSRVCVSSESLDPTRRRAGWWMAPCWLLTTSSLTIPSSRAIAPRSGCFSRLDTTPCGRGARPWHATARSFVLSRGLHGAWCRRAAQQQYSILASAVVWRCARLCRQGGAHCP